MFWKTFFTVFTTVFLAELGDKTQLATLLFATDKDKNLLSIFFGASVALVLTSAIGVFAGALLGEFVPVKVLHYVAGAGFVIIGIWTIYNA